MTDAQRRGGGGGGGGDEQHNSDHRLHRNGEPSHRERDRGANATQAAADESSQAGELFTLLRQLSSRVNRTPSIGTRGRNEASQMTAPSKSEVGDVCAYGYFLPLQVYYTAGEDEPRLAHSLLRICLDSVEPSEAARRDAGGGGASRVHLDDGAQVSWRSAVLTSESSTATSTSTATTTATQPTHRTIIQDAEEVGTYSSSNDGDTASRLEEIDTQDNAHDNESESERETGNSSGRINLNVAIRSGGGPWRALRFLPLFVYIYPL